MSLGGAFSVAVRLTSLFVNGQTMRLCNTPPLLQIAIGSVALFFEFVVGRAEFCYRLFSEKLLERPLLYGGLLLILEFRNVADRVL